MNVVLIGYRGTGKTSVGRQLAAMLGWPLEDTDAEIVRRAGRSIAEIFAESGEATFRELEAAVVTDFGKRDGIVLACGGGVVLRESNREAIRRNGRVIWLRASVDTILGRLADDGATRAQRPRLTEHDAREEVEMVLAEREPIYAGCAEVEVVTDGKGMEAIATEIVAVINP